MDDDTRFRDLNPAEISPNFREIKSKEKDFGVFETLEKIQKEK